MADAAALPELVEVIRRLRAECPWYAEQTHESLVRYLLEESQEVVEAIDGGLDAELCEELGDLLLQVVIHAAIAEEQGRFDIDDVAEGITAKMRRRNPHVFGDAPRGLSAAEVDAQYQAIKATEKAAGS